MADTIRFEDGSAYERYMGAWSKLVGNSFLDWLAPEPGLRWIDIGCGNGAFTDVILQRCAPKSVHGIDPSEAQLAYARNHIAADIAQFSPGDAMALPFAENAFDVAVMPLVIFFVPEPAKGVAEMKRVVQSGGWITAYAWDIPGGGFPYQALHDEMRGLGIDVPKPPSDGASSIDVMRDLWAAAGLQSVESRPITVQRTFADFEDYWATIQGGPSVGAKLKAMSANDLATLKSRMRDRLPTEANGKITCSGCANAVKGRR